VWGNPTSSIFLRRYHLYLRSKRRKVSQGICLDLSHKGLRELIGRGRFRFIGLPLKIRGGTGSPVRAVAVFEE